MEEEKPKKKRKQAAADGAGEHKRPWQEVYATVEEIEANRRLLANDAELEDGPGGDSGDSAF